MESYQLDRHFKLWEENNKSLKRIIFLTVAISIALIVKVLTPFVADSGSKKPILDKIAALTQEKTDAARKIQVIENIEGVLGEVNRFIADQPWQKEKAALIERYQRMHANPAAAGYAPASYQQEADKTIHTIGKMLRGQILEPLRRSMQVPAQGDALANLTNEVTTLEQFIDSWEQHYIGKNWYRTLDLKEATMLDLTRDLNRRLSEFAAVIAHELTQIKQARETATAQLEALNRTIAAEGDKLKEIDKELQAILPAWLRGLVSAEQVIQLLPLFLLGSAIYVLVLGLGLTRHYELYATGRQFTPGVTDDPAMSSTWTLIARGRYGTLLTLGAYLGFFVLVWVLFEKATGLLGEWVIIDPRQAWVASPKAWLGFRWLARLVFLALIAAACLKPWRTGTLPRH